MPAMKHTPMIVPPAGTDVALRPRGGEVAPLEGVRRPDRVRGELLLGLQRGEHHEDQRGQRVNRQRGEDQVEDGAGQPFPLSR
jgi:hypothetical protein